MTQVLPPLPGSAIPPASHSAAAHHLITQLCLQGMFRIALQASITSTNQPSAFFVEAYHIQCNMLLRPYTLSETVDGKPFLIPDHVSRLVPFEEEKILSAGSNTKFSLAFGNKKQKIS